MKQASWCIESQTNKTKVEIREAINGSKDNS